MASPLTSSCAKYFIAIVLPDPAQGFALEIKNRLFEQYGLKGALRSPAHITLHRPFEWQQKKEQQLIGKLHDFPNKPLLDITLKNYGAFEPRVLYLNVEVNAELTALHKQLTGYCKRELSLFNEDEDLRGFHPHVTIAFRDLKKPLFYELWKQYGKEKFEMAFQANGFSLLKLHEKWEVIENFT
jgi:2'-5' RNA ligase